MLLEFEKVSVRARQDQAIHPDCIVKTDTPNARPLLIGAVWSAFVEWTAETQVQVTNYAETALQEFSRNLVNIKPGKTRKLQRGWFNIRLRERETGLESMKMVTWTV